MMNSLTFYPCTMVIFELFTFALLCATITIADILFNDTNNMFSGVNATGASTTYLINLGKFNSLSECQNAFHKYNGARSFVWYEPDYDDNVWAKYCYIRTDTWWNPTAESKIISGQIDNFFNCMNDNDCELNGQCNPTTKKCECKPAWTGNFCQYLNFKKGSKNLGYQRKDYSQWGGDARYDKVTNKWILYAVEMYNECGINACCCGNSQIVKALSDNPGGPYTYSNVAVPYFSHEPMLGYSSSDNTWLLHHWGNGKSSEVKVDTDCSNGISSGKHLPNCDGPGDILYNYISYSKDLNNSNGEFLKNMMKIPGDYIDFDLCPSNPYIFDNGSVLQFWTERASWEQGSIIHKMTSTGWNRNYTLSMEQLWINSLGDGTSLEDPFLWFESSDKTYHLLFHGMIEDDNDDQPWLRAAQGRHAYSKNGIDWILSPHYTYNTTICYSDSIECVNYCRRERPHLIFDTDTNEPLYLTNGMQLNCDGSTDKTFMGAVPLYTSNDIAK
eukprot:468731_1